MLVVDDEMRWNHTLRRERNNISNWLHFFFKLKTVWISVPNESFEFFRILNFWTKRTTLAVVPRPRILAHPKVIKKFSQRHTKSHIFSKKKRSNFQKLFLLIFTKIKKKKKNRGKKQKQNKKNIKKFLESSVNLFSFFPSLNYSTKN